MTGASFESGNDPQARIRPRLLRAMSRSLKVRTKINTIFVAAWTEYVGVN